MKRALPLLLCAFCGCASIVARHPVAGDVPRVPFAAAKKDLLSSARKGILEKRGFVMATMKGGGVSSVEEDALELTYDRYLGLLVDQTVATKVSCPYEEMGELVLNQYKTGGAGRAAYLTYEVPLGARCNDLAFFFGQEEHAAAFARALLVLKRRSAEGPTPEEARPGGGLSKEDLASIVQAAVAGATQGRPAGDGRAAAPVSDVDAPAYRLPERRDDFAVVVGIGKYSDLPEAQFAERDAEAVKSHLLALGFPSRNVVHLSGEKAGYKAIEKFVETWLPRNVDGNSRVLFYFSGHGAPDAQTGQAYLLPYDGDPNFLENTGYPIRRLYEKLSAFKAKEVLVAMDACFSGAGGRSVLAKGARPLVTKADAAAAPQNLTVFAATGADQITSTLEDQGHGTFTYYFLKGLSGEAKDGTGAVTAQGLFDYLKPKVQDAARRQNREQTPVLLGAGERELARF